MSETILPVSLEAEMSESYGRYAQYTILHRAIPDVRDGLKPVQRRIVYAMSASGNLPDRPYRKSAKTVGDVMGNFHPHGDQSIYEALVRLAQPWKMAYPLIDGHGNFGSMDDDPAAAMRYTEARLAPVAMTLLTDIDKETVAFIPNFDQSSEEPVVLPARFPNLLVNGCSGLSTGFATEVPPHNLGEILDAALELSKKPEATTSELLSWVKGPDFPTGGIIVNASDLPELYEKGRGKVALRGKTRFEPATRQSPALIVIDEIPFGVIKSDLVAQLDQLRIAGSVRGVTDVRDESDRSGLRIVVELEKSADAEGVLHFFFKKTDLQITVPVQMVAIADGAPQLLGLRELLRHFLKHRQDVVLRRSKFDLEASRKRLHEVEGLIRAIDVLDQVLYLIRTSVDRPEAKARLISELSFSEPQAETILELKLHRLTSLQVHKLQKEAEELRGAILKLEGILTDEKQLLRVVRQEIKDLRTDYARERLTQVTDAETRVEVAVTVTVPPQRAVVALTAEGYIKRCGARVEQDPEKAGVRPGDVLRWVVESNTTHRLLLFCSEGNAYNLPVHTLPEAKWTDTGSALVNLTDLKSGRKIVGCCSVEEFRPDRFVTMVSASGKVKRTSLAEFETNRSTGILAAKVSGDELARAFLSGPRGQILLLTEGGMSIRFDLSEVPEQGRAAAGVRGISLEPGDRIVEALLLDKPTEPAIAILTDQGKGKQSELGAYPFQARGGKGTTTLKRPAKGAVKLIAAAALEFPEEIWWVATSTGRLVQISAKQFPDASRDGQIQRIIELLLGEIPLHILPNHQKRAELLALQAAQEATAQDLGKMGLVWSAPEGGGSAKPDSPAQA